MGCVKWADPTGCPCVQSTQSPHAAPHPIPPSPAIAAQSSPLASASLSRDSGLCLYAQHSVCLFVSLAQCFLPEGGSPLRAELWGMSSPSLCREPGTSRARSICQLWHYSRDGCLPLYPFGPRLPSGIMSRLSLPALSI